MTDDTKPVGFDPFWERYLEGEIRPQITTIVRIVKEKIVPIFKQAETEANAVADEVWHATGFSGDVDPGDIAEMAHEEGINRFIFLTELTYGILNRDHCTKAKR